MEMKLKGHTIKGGKAEGEAIVWRGAFSFLGDFNIKTGLVSIPGHELDGQSVANKVVVCATGHGSSGGPYYAYQAVESGTAPAAVICIEAEPVLALAAITAGIPMVDKLDKNPFDVIETGDYIKVDATQGIVEVTKAQR